MFLDIRNFTANARGRPPEEVVEFRGQGSVEVQRPAVARVAERERRRVERDAVEAHH